MSKSFVDFKAIKAAITIEQVLKHYGLIDQFKSGRDSLSGPCPLHKGSNPTQFRVSISKNIWNCFGECKHGGNVLDLVAELENVTIHSAALKIIEWFHLDRNAMSGDSEAETREPINSERKTAAPKPNRASKSTQTPAKDSQNKPLQFRLEKLQRDHPYLAARGLLPETIGDFGLGFCAKGMMAGRIAIPIPNAQGNIVAYAGRWPGQPAEDTPKYKLPPGFRKSQELFNLDRAAKEPAEHPWVIVEGFFDCMKLWQHGCRKVVALMGSSLSSEQEALIRRHTNSESHVIVMLDEDDAGQAGREDVVCRLSKFCFVKMHQFDEPGTQPDQLTAEEVQELIGGAS